MTSSSSPPLSCGLDTMVLVYSLLQGSTLWKPLMCPPRACRECSAASTSGSAIRTLKLLKISGRTRAAVAIYLDASTHNHHIPRIGWFDWPTHSLDLHGTASTEWAVVSGQWSVVNGQWPARS
jgi:hypothetical protein